MGTRSMVSCLAKVVAFALVCSSAETSSRQQDVEARRIMDVTGVKGGLVVHVGCGDGTLTAALRITDSYIVHGLDTNSRSVEEARNYIQQLGLYGKVAIDTFDGVHLPYIANLVNLVVCENLGKVSMDEVMRVLAPNGVAYVRDGKRWEKTVKPWPEGMDEWTHYLHDPQGTMVGQDSLVGLPRRIQWVGGPKWLRNHDFMSSLNGLVSSNGRIFYLIDEGLRNHIYLPARWAVVARDAFSGTILWKRPIDQWFPHTWPFKSGPGHMPRRVVAVGDRVYVTLGLTAPLTVLDAATGETIRTYDGTESTEEIVVSDGTLFLLVDPEKEPFVYQHKSDNRGEERNRVNLEFGWSRNREPRTVMAVSASNGEVLWKHQDHVASLTLAVDGRKVYYFDGNRIVALDRRSGKTVWASDTAGAWPQPATGYAPRLIVDKEVVVLSSKGPKGGRLAGVSSEDGKVLWRSGQLNSGHYSPEDVFLIDGVIWTAETGKGQEHGTHFQGIDAQTGEITHDFVADQIEAFFMHQRCYPGRATTRYIMTSGTGTEFLELGTKHCELHHWLRGSCIYGIMPCNGLIYRPPETCACFYQSKLAHFCALAPASEATRQEPRGQRLEQGPAYSTLRTPPHSALRTRHAEWPTYRHDTERSGYTEHSVPSGLKPVWQTRLGGKLSTMTAADGKLFVSAIDQHTVHALDAGSGRRIWSYTAGGRVDSPPTIYDGLVLFGCADGWVYCLRASDGDLVWRFRAAPGDDKHVSYQQVESVWPLHGSVLVHDGVAYCLAGRNMFVDGGMRLARVDVRSGKLISETVLDDTDPRTGKNLQTLMAGKAVPVANSDIFSYDGKNIYLRSQKFDLDGNRLDLDLVRGKETDQQGEGRHLFCPTGFLDEWWFHRSYWIYGRNAGEGHGEYPKPRGITQTGRIMVFDDSRVYSFFAQNVGNNINPRTYYSLYASDKELSVAPRPPAQNDSAANKKKTRARAQETRSQVRHIWEMERPGLLANAMVLAGGSLFIAGPPDVANEENTYGFIFGGDDEINRQMRRQEAAWLGKQGALLWAVSADTGEKLAEYKLGAIPVWDGMIAANGRVYISMRDGRVMCMGSE